MKNINYITLFLLLALLATVGSFTKPAYAANCDGLPASSGTMPAGTYTLTDNCIITGTFTISSGTVTINGGGFAIDGSSSYQIFSVSSGATLELNNVTLRNGRATFGGAIFNFGTVTISDSTLSGNSATDSGGAIRNHSTLSISNSTLSGNSATTGFGGAIYNFGGVITVTNSTLSDNTVTTYNGGAIANENGGNVTITSSTLSNNMAVNTSGAVYNYYSTLTINNSTISGNSAGTYGAIFSRGTLTISNSTISNNSTSSNGGAIANADIAYLINSTISYNSANNLGGAFYNGGTVNLINTIISNNTSATGNCYSFGLGTINDNGGNLEDTNTCGLSSGFNTDPLLGIFNGSYYPLQAGSPAIDSAPTCAGLTTDQIGTPRPQGSACDIGAIEVKSLSTTNGTIDSGSYVLTADITLTGTLHITQGVVSIEGNGFAIDGNNTHRLFLVTNNAVLNLNQVTLRNGNGYGGSAILNFGQANVLNSLILNNNATYNGGAISNERGSMLFIGNTTISGNTAGSSGGAIYNRGGIFTVNSTFSNNSAGNSGGAIFNNINSTFTVTNSSFSNNAATSSEGGAIFNNTKGNIEIQNSTFSGNSAVNGGAIRNRGISTLTNNTISENSATSLGGAIANTNTMSIINNIISNNTSTSGNCYNSGGAIADSGGNLEDTNTCGLSSGFNTNPLLGAFNGSYYPLQASSPAIDAAPTCAGLFADQIGTSRPQGSACDIGAIEYIN